jgi:hypothetical protein
VEAGIEAPNLGLAAKAMKELGAQNKEISEAGYQSALILIRAALPLVPVKTTTLKGNIKAGRVLHGAKVFVPGKTVPYANPIHWGWAVVSYNHKGSLKPGTYRGIEPQPFFNEALGYTREEIVANYNKLMLQAIHKLETEVNRKK